MPEKSKQYQILIVGGGTAGISAAARLKKENRNLKIGIVEPSGKHYYQSAFTLAGAGAYDMADACKDTAALIPPGVDWIKDEVTAFHPDKNKVTTAENGTVGYEYLIVAPGVVYDYSAVEGLAGALDKGVACSNYTDPKRVWKNIQKFKGGTALFTLPQTLVKHRAAAQEVMYLMADYLHKKGLHEKSKIIFMTPDPAVSEISEMRRTLEKVIRRYQISVEFFRAPVKIDAGKKTVYFKNTDPSASKVEKEKEREISFDFLHITPPQSPPEALKKSKLANEGGWTDCDPYSLQHKQYKNVFGIGDATGIPNTKSGLAIRKQLPVVTDNIISLIGEGKIVNRSYDGYSAVSLITGYGKMMLGEFDYDRKLTADGTLKKMLIFKGTREHWRLWLLRKYGLPHQYWTKMVRGEL